MILKIRGRLNLCMITKSKSNKALHEDVMKNTQNEANQIEAIIGKKLRIIFVSWTNSD